VSRVSQKAQRSGVDNKAYVKFNEIIRSLDFWLLFINGKVINKPHTTTNLNTQELKKRYENRMINHSLKLK